MLALTDLRTSEQIEADAEIDRTSLDEADELVVWLQRAMAESGTFFDLWRKRNNLPAPPCPGCLVRELERRDLVGERTTETLSHQTIKARRQRKVELSTMASKAQLALL